MAMLQPSTVDQPVRSTTDPYAIKTPIITGTLPKAPTLASTSTTASPTAVPQRAPAPTTAPLPAAPLPGAPVSAGPVGGTPVSTTPPAVTLPAAPPATGTPIQLSDTTMPPPITLPSAPSAAAGVPGATVQPFGPGQDLRYDAILPTSVDRMQLANQYFDQYADATNPAYEQTLRAATQRAAANGILGSGMLTNTYGDVATQRAHELDLQRQGFLTDALQGTIADNAANRDELRTERGYQTQTNQQAIQDQINQLLLQDQLGGNAFNRQLDLAQLLGQLGYAGNPDEALLTGAGQNQQQADQTYALLGQLLGQIGQRS